MRSQRVLFITTAVLEFGAGLFLVGSPGLPIWLVLNAREPSPEALILGRAWGAALLAIGIACWMARGDAGSRSGRGILWGLLIYNVAACVILAGALMAQMVGLLLWPALALHAVLAIWCVVCIRASSDG